MVAVNDLRDREGLSREQFVIAMTKALFGVVNIDDARERLTAYCRAGFFDHDIIVNDAECRRREVIRRSISNLRDKARCPKVSQSG